MRCDLPRKIEEKRGVTLTEYGTSEARSSPLSNELHSVPYQKQSGPVLTAKKTASWDEDWSLINRRNAPASNPLSSNLTAEHSASQAIPLQSSTFVVNQQTTSIPPVDVEWPPPNSSSVFVSQSLADSKLNQNSGGASDRTFDDIDPFVNWPPRPNGSSISSLSSSYKPNSTTGRISSDSGPQNFDFLGNTNFFGSKPYQKNAISINKEQSGMNTFVSASANDSLPLGLGQSIGRQANMDIGSLFPSANIGGHTAPKLAPPPSTAVGRGRGRNQASLSSHTKPSSEQPRMDLL